MSKPRLEFISVGCIKYPRKVNKSIKKIDPMNFSDYTVVVRFIHTSNINYQIFICGGESLHVDVLPGMEVYGQVIGAGPDARDASVTTNKGYPLCIIYSVVNFYIVLVLVLIATEDRKY